LSSTIFQYSNIPPFHLVYAPPLWGGPEPGLLDPDLYLMTHLIDTRDVLRPQDVKRKRAERIKIRDIEMLPILQMISLTTPGSMEFAKDADEIRSLWKK
jgi:hypothetical protein